MRLPALLIALFGVMFVGPARAEDGPPNLDIEKTCSSPGRAEVQIQTDQKDSQDGCLRSEHAARDELRRRWNEFPAAAKRQCTQQAQAGGFPSYVETVTCLELASGGVPPQKNANRSPDAGPMPKDAEIKGGSSKLTTEPLPNQRTNPIDVLEKK